MNWQNEKPRGNMRKNETSVASATLLFYQVWAITFSQETFSIKLLLKCRTVSINFSIPKKDKVQVY